MNDNTSNICNNIQSVACRLASTGARNQHTGMKELLVYGISGVASLFIFGYCVHIFVGGLVSEQTEIILIAAVVTLGAAAIAWLAWDTIRRSR